MAEMIVAILTMAVCSAITIAVNMYTSHRLLRQHDERADEYDALMRKFLVLGERFDALAAQVNPSVYADILADTAREAAARGAAFAIREAIPAEDRPTIYEALPGTPEAPPPKAARHGRPKLDEPGVRAIAPTVHMRMDAVGGPPLPDPGLRGRSLRPSTQREDAPQLTGGLVRGGDPAPPVLREPGAEEHSAKMTRAREALERLRARGHVLAAPTAVPVASDEGAAEILSVEGSPPRRRAPKIRLAGTDEDVSDPPTVLSDEPPYMIAQPLD